MIFSASAILVVVIAAFRLVIRRDQDGLASHWLPERPGLVPEKIEGIEDTDIFDFQRNRACTSEVLIKEHIQTGHRSERQICRSGIIICFE